MIRNSFIISCLLLGSAWGNSAFPLPKPEPYFSAISPIFAYDPAYGALIGAAWFSYPTGQVDNATVNKDLNVVTRFGPHGALSYQQTMPDFNRHFGLDASFGINNFFDYETSSSRAEIESTSEQLSVHSAFKIRRRIAPKIELFTGAEGSVQWQESESRNSHLNSVTGLRWDSRNDALNTTRGTFIESSFRYLPAAFDTESGSSSWIWANDARLFLPFVGDSSFAFRQLTETSQGDSLRASAGGPELLRGYLGDQFDSASMLAGQAEYRFPIWSFIRGVTFYDVAWMIESQSDQTYQSAGFGFRFGLPPDQSISVRWDNAVNGAGQWQSIVNFNHVF